MEELPDEVTLLMLAHINPLSDTAAVSGTCRKWWRLMLDPYLWKGFLHRTFPTHLSVEQEREERKEREGEGGANPRPWRHLYLEKARHLKRLLDNPPVGERGNYGRLLAAALVGCLPLAEREVARLVAAHGGGPMALSTLSYRPYYYGDTTSLVGECLHRACLAGSVPLAKLFIEQGADVGGKECLQAAVQSGNPQLVSFILDRAVGNKVMAHILTVIESAAAQGNVDTLKLLLERGAVTFNNTAISQAAGSGSLEAVQLLLDRGFYYPKPLSGWGSEDPINYAVRSGHLAIVRLLQQHGATLHRRHVVTALNRDESPSMEMLKLLAPALCQSNWRECLTSHALQRGDIAVCRFLVNQGVDLNVTFGSGCDLGQCTALHYAVLYNYEEMARCLLECGASVDVKTKGMRMTALSLARQYANKASRVVMAHRPGKRKRQSTSEVEKKKNENENENEEEKKEKEKKNEDGGDGNKNDGDGDDEKTKPARKKQKKQKEPSPEKREEKELEAKVRQLAKLKGDAKLDVFTLRQMLRRRGVLAGDVPKRKLQLLQLTVDWLSAGN